MFTLVCRGDDFGNTSLGSINVGKILLLLLQCIYVLHLIDNFHEFIFQYFSTISFWKVSFEIRKINKLCNELVCETLYLKESGYDSRKWKKWVAANVKLYSFVKSVYSFMWETSIASIWITCFNVNTLLHFHFWSALKLL